MSVYYLGVAINKYPDAPLRGCVNDLFSFEQAYTAKREPWTESKILADKDATAESIRDGLRWLVVQHADLLIFQYSGHGTQVPDESGDEGRRKYDSALVPVDYAKAGVILDDELGAYFDMVPQGTTLVTLLDSCFSGKSQRFAPLLSRINMGKIPRFVAPHKLSKSALLDSDRHAERLLGPKQDRSRTKLFEWLDKNIDRNDERNVMLSASQWNVTSADAYIDGRWQGAGTHALMRAWSSARYNSNYETLERSANNWLRENHYEQRVQLGANTELRKSPAFK